MNVKPKKEKVPRQKMPEQDPQVRVKNFNEVPTRLYGGDWR